MAASDFGVLENAGWAPVNAGWAPDAENNQPLFIQEGPDWFAVLTATRPCCNRRARHLVMASAAVAHQVPAEVHAGPEPIHVSIPEEGARAFIRNRAADDWFVAAIVECPHCGVPSAQLTVANAAMIDRLPARVREIRASLEDR